ncbi:MAG TPA: Hpt domain-containing protein [Burkholderiales bacterium]|jgi:chemosensory pili system protein ChpA (sensor histidine kinase/response regulator)
MANATLLSWINAEVDQALKLVRDNIAKVTGKPEDDAPLRVCPDHLHQVSGALRMVGLAGATRFCEAIEGSFSGLAQSPRNGAAIGTIDRAVLALKEFVADLARGQADVPMRLYPVYRELATLSGKNDASEKELFFPDQTAQAPAHPRAKTVLQAELSAYLQAQRAVFQRGMLGWLKKQPNGLEEMRQALDGLWQVAGQLPEPRSLWWVALALLEGIGQSQDEGWLNTAKPLCNKVDFQIRDLAAGSEKMQENLLRDVLYAAAKCKPVTPKIKEVRQLFQLDSLFPEAAPVGGVMEFDIEFLEVALYDLHSRLEALKGAWVQYVSGEQKSAGRFRELVSAFKAKAVTLGNQHLIKLLDAIALVAAKLPDPYPRQNQFMVIEMASAFLLIEQVIDHFTTPPEDLAPQIVIMGGWLLDAAKGKSTGEVPKGLRPDLTQQIGALQLRAQVAKEIIANLQHVEQVLDAYVRDGSRRDTLAALPPYLRQIHGALMVLRFDRAAESLAICEKMIAGVAEKELASSTEDIDWIAEGLSSLGFFLEPCLHGREPAEQAIQLFFERYGKRTATQAAMAVTASTAAPAEIDQTIKIDFAAAAADLTNKMASPAAEQAARPDVAPKAPRVKVDEELLGIFLDEADEVLQTINDTVPLCRTEPNNPEALTTIRRSFHTLKGSGRMVGLMDLGEVAWEIERLLNGWLEQKRPATPGLLDLVTASSASFAEWVGGLRDNSLKGEVDGKALVAMVKKLKEAPAETQAAPAPARAAAAVPDLVIDLDDAMPSLAEIYLGEAVQHVAALETEFAAWRKAPSAASHEFMRAAHTLASSSQTAGFGEIADLADTLEEWMPFAAQANQPGNAQVLQNAITKLRQMVDAVTRGEAQGSGAEEARRLREVTGRLKASPPPPMEISQQLRFDKERTQPVAVASAPAPEAIAAAAAAEAVEAAGRSKRVMRDDIDPQLLPIFLEEATELVPQIGADIRDFKANPADDKVVASLRRGLHTLKGSARMAGAIRLGELTHIMESRMEAAIEANQLTPELFAELEEKMDRLSLDVERMQAGGGPAAVVVDTSQKLPAAADITQQKVAPAPAAPAAPVDITQKMAVPAQARAAEAPLPSPAAMLRVNADTLDHLITESGEVAIARSRVEAELRGVKQSMIDLGESITRLRNQLREIEVQADSQMQSRLAVSEQQREYDPLEFDRYTRLQELTRMMAEGLGDVVAIQQTLGKNVGETDAALLAQARINREVQQELMRMRAVPFNNLSERLYRIVRQTSRELDKKAELTLEGAELELDRSVLERIGAPLEHMIRNCMAHGIEMPAERVAAGKEESGRISIVLRQESNEMALVIADDGAGLNLDKLKQKGVEMGLVQAGDEPSEAEIAQLIFASGLSTADKVTSLAGRGVGMDVVKNEITAIGGRVDIATQRGQGTSFTIYLPLTLAVTQAVLVRAGNNLFAVSSAMVEQVLRMKTDGMTGLYAAKSVEFQGRAYPLHYLQNLLGASGAAEIQTYNSVLLLRSGVQRIALHVDELVGNEEIVVKNVGPQLARVPGVSGATVLADGAIVLILNPVALASRVRTSAARLGATMVVKLGATAALAAQGIDTTAGSHHAGQVVMVVDDSLTVRKITSRLLEREGYTVLTAKDGVDALEQMRETLPGVMLVDIEMPRMDGFDLTRNVRGDPRTAGIPIVIISSRTADKHRNQAIQLGVNAFLGKPYQEAELLQHVAKYLAA